MMPSGIEADGVLDLAFPLDARLSPDGRFVAYTVADVNRERVADQASLWVVDVATATSRRLTGPGTLDTGPSWSSDGRSLVFRSAGASGIGQICTLAVDGGAPNPVTALPAGVAMLGPQWSPSGELVAFGARPGPLRDPSLPHRVTRQFWRLDGAGLIDDVMHELHIVRAQGGEPRQLTHDRGLIISAQWSPSGDELLYVVFSEDDAPMARVRVVNATSGATRTVYEEPNYFFPPAVSWLPDGRIIRTTTNVVHADFPPVGVVIEDGTTDPQPRSTGVDGWIFGLVQGDFPFMAFFAPRLIVSDDGARAYAPVQRGGAVEIWEVALVGEQHARPVVTGEQVSQPYGVAGDDLLCITTTMHEPPDLFVVSTATGEPRRLTSLNAARYPADGFAVEHLDLRAADGEAVEGWFLRPRDADGPVPTVLNNHGGPHAAWGHAFSFDNHLLIAAGYGVLMVNQRGSTGYTREFATCLHGDWGNFDISDLLVGVDAAVERGLADPDRLGVLGISAGAYLTAWLTSHSDRFKAAIVESPCLNFSAMTGGDVGYHYAKWMGTPSGLGVEAMDPFVRFSPTTYSGSCATPTLVIQHELDLRTPPGNSDEYYAQLRQHGCVAEMLRMPVTSHAGSIELGSPVTRVAQNEALLDWLTRYVLKG